MKKLCSLAMAVVGCAPVAYPQGRPVDWPTYGGDARRTGWEKSDTRITKDNIKDFQLVLKRKLDSPGGSGSLTAPVIIGLLISYKGFKELAFVSSPAGDIWSLDVDTDRVFWNKKFAGGGKGRASGGSGICSGGMTASPALTPPVTFGARRTARPTASPSPGEPPTPAGRSTALPARVGGGGFGAPRPLYVLSSDGVLHQVATSNGADQFPPLEFLPANAKASSLLMDSYTIYTTTSSDCGGVPNAVWALDLSQEDPKPVSFPIKDSQAQGPGGLAVGNDGTVYVQTGPGSSTLMALSSKDLKVKGSFVTSGASVSKSKSAAEMNYATPVVFDYKGHDVVVSAGGDGKLHVHDSQAFGGADHKTSLASTPVLPAKAGAPNTGIWGGLTSWEDAEGVRWVAAPVWGPLNPELKVPLSNGDTPNGSIVVFRMEDKDGKPALVPAWTSRDLQSPQPAVTTTGVLFALSSGAYARQGDDLRAGNSKGATLYAFDGATGKEMYSTGNKVSTPANLTGLAVANGRVYFTTTDSTLYAFGVYLER